MSPTSIVANLLLFASVAFVFVFAALLIGRLIRPKEPNPEKGEIYECGEPSIGPGYLQFDLRFYVVALLFIIFDVEVAFFFPWATVFGKGTQLRNPTEPAVVALATTEGPKAVADTAQGECRLSPAAERTLRELGVPKPALPHPTQDLATNAAAVESSARSLVLTAMADMAVFFGVLLVGFAYLWRRGDLNWVRATDSRRSSHSDAVFSE